MLVALFGIFVILFMRMYIITPVCDSGKHDLMIKDSLIYMKLLRRAKITISMMCSNKLLSIK